MVVDGGEWMDGIGFFFGVTPPFFMEPRELHKKGYINFLKRLHKKGLHKDFPGVT